MGPESRWKVSSPSASGNVLLLEVGLGRIGGEQRKEFYWGSRNERGEFLQKAALR